jgi:general secretion pathway protein J
VKLCAPISHTRSGFTLVEVLVAMFVLALIATAAGAIIVSTLASQAQLEAAAQRAQGIDLFRSMTRLDLAQAVPRPAKRADGAHETGLISEGFGGERLFAVTRMAENADVQRVEYHLVDGALVRRSFARPDRQQATPFQDIILLSEVDTVDISYLRGSIRLAVWGQETAAPLGLPDALEWQVRFQDGQDFRYVTLVGGA